MASTPTTPTGTSTATADDKASTKTKDGKKDSVTVTVFVPAGSIPRNQIFKTAITAIRDQIPLVYSLDPELGKVSDLKEHDGVKGRDYEVVITYTTDVKGADPVKLDQEIEKLTVPSLTDYNEATAAANPNIGA